MDEEKLKLLREKIAKSNKYILYVDYPDLLDLIKIIENQQKEIEEQSKRSWVHVKENGEVDPLFYISKDKIKEKIKELKKCKDISQVVGSIVILEELLEEK